MREKNFKSLLQQHAQQQFGVTPHYHIIDEQGPDHAKSFKVAAEFAGHLYPAQWGQSKERAEQHAAHEALRELGLEPLNEVPTGDEIYKLSLLARVAFAARCARRVQPLFEATWRKATRKQVDSVIEAIRFAERFAAHPTRYGDTDFIQLSSAAHGTALQNARDVSAGGTDVAPAEAAAYAAAAAAAANAADDDQAAVAVIRAVAYAARGVGDATAAIRHDYDLLLRTSQAEHWTDDTPVPPEFFGPMWPEGAPEGWSIEEATAPAPPSLKIEIQTPPGMDEQASKEFNQRVARLFAEMSALHVAMGGNGLRILDDASAAPVLDEDELPIGVGDPGCVEAGGGR